MTILVTGGSGFVGGHLIERLVAAGEPVRALARSRVAAETVARYGADPVMGDLADADTLARAAAGCQDVIHSAAMMTEWASYEAFERVNVTGTASLLDAAKRAGARRFVQIGAAPVVIRGDGPTHMADETWPLSRVPWSPYLDTKSRADKLVRSASDEEMRTSVVRPSLIWGLRAPVLERLRKRIAAGRWAWIDGGRHPHSTCHVANVCEGTMLALERGRPGEAYNLNDGPPVELRAFLEGLVAALGLDAGTREVPFRMADLLSRAIEGTWRLLALRTEPPVTRLMVRLSGREFTTSDAKARAELGYAGCMSHEAGLAEMASQFAGAHSKTEGTRCA